MTVWVTLSGSLKIKDSKFVKDVTVKGIVNGRRRNQLSQQILLLQILRRSGKGDKVVYKYSLPIL